MNYNNTTSHIIPTATARGIAIFAIALVAFFHLGHVELPPGANLAQVFSVNTWAFDDDGGGDDFGDDGGFDDDGGGDDGGDGGFDDDGGGDDGGDGGFDDDGGGDDGGDDGFDDDGGGDDGDGGDDTEPDLPDEPNEPPFDDTPFCQLSASRTTIDTPGQAVVLTWNTQNTVSRTLTGFGEVGESGSRTVNPTQNSTYTLRVTDSDGDVVVCPVSVTLVTEPPVSPVCTISVSPTSVVRGGQVTVTWNTTNTNTFRIPGIQSDTLPLSGSRTVTIDQNTSFVGTATGPGGTANCQATVTILVVDAPTCTVSVSPTTVQRGGQVTVSWNTTNTNTFRIPGVDSATLPLSGSRTLTINENTTFTGTATGSNNQTATCAATVTVSDLPPTIQCTMNISKSKVNKGESALVTWTSTGATSVIFSKLTGADLNGSQEVRPNERTQYSGVFTNGSESVTCSAVIEVEEGGGGSCTGSCGSSRPKATVTLSKTPFDQPLASGIISLTQVPYTGFDADPLTAFIFWLVVLVWSAVVAYFVLIKGYWKRLFWSTPPPQMPSGSAYPLPIERPLTSVTTTQSVQEVYTPAPVNLPGSASPAMVEPIFAEAHPQERKTEDRLYQERMLVSKGGLSRLAALSESALDQAMYQAKGAYSREDGWILLSDERIQELLQHNTDTVLPTVAAQPAHAFMAQPPIEHAQREVNSVSTHTFLMALFAGNRSEAIALSRALPSNGVEAFFTEVAMALDDVYRARMERRTSDHPSLEQAASRLSDDKLEALVSVMANVMDQLYQNPQTAVKLAVAQALQITN